MTERNGLAQAQYSQDRQNFIDAINLALTVPAIEIEVVRTYDNNFALNDYEVKMPSIGWYAENLSYYPDTLLDDVKQAVKVWEEYQRISFCTVGSRVITDLTDEHGAIPGVITEVWLDGMRNPGCDVKLDRHASGANSLWFDCTVLQPEPVKPAGFTLSEYCYFPLHQEQGGGGWTCPACIRQEIELRQDMISYRALGVMHFENLIAGYRAEIAQLQAALPANLAPQEAK